VSDSQLASLNLCLDEYGTQRPPQERAMPSIMHDRQTNSNVYIIYKYIYIYICIYNIIYIHIYIIYIYRYIYTNITITVCNYKTIMALWGVA